MQVLVLLSQFEYHRQYMPEVEQYITALGLDHADIMFRQVDKGSDAYMYAEDTYFSFTLDLVLTFSQDAFEAVVGGEPSLRIGPALGKPIWSENFPGVMVFGFYPLKYMRGNPAKRREMRGYLKAAHRRIWEDCEVFEYKEDDFVY